MVNHVTTADFAGSLVPPDVQAKILNALVGGAPFAASLTRQPTNRTSVVFPTASPTGFAWLGELDPIPTVNLNDAAYAVAVSKIAGLIDLSNELVDDSSINVTATMSALMKDSLSRQLDLGLLHGSGANNEPAGVIAAAPVVDAPSLLEGVAVAVGEIGDAGGQADTMAASATALAQANATTTDAGALVYPNGFAAASGLKPVTVPGLTTPLVYDSSRIFFVLNQALSEVAVSGDYHFNLDAVTMRVKARATVACPVPTQAIRALTVTPAPPARAAAKKG